MVKGKKVIPTSASRNAHCIALEGVRDYNSEMSVTSWALRKGGSALCLAPDRVLILFLLMDQGQKDTRYKSSWRPWSPVWPYSSPTKFPKIMVPVSCVAGKLHSMKSDHRPRIFMQAGASGLQVSQYNNAIYKDYTKEQHNSIIIWGGGKERWFTSQDQT